MEGHPQLQGERNWGVLSGTRRYGPSFNSQPLELRTPLDTSGSGDDALRASLPERLPWSLPF